MKHYPDIESLFEKYLQNRCSPEEAEQVLVWLEAEAYGPEQKDRIIALLAEKLPAHETVHDSVKQRLQDIQKNIQLHIDADQPTEVRQLSFTWVRYAAAAVLVLALGIVIYLFSQKGQEARRIVVKPELPVKNDALPGGNKAVLTLADGQRIVLDEARNGELIRQGEALVIKLDGLLTYDKTGDKGEVLYHTVNTPAGGQYQLILADGSKVWLNSESSLRFPTSFPGTERKVELKGEGYFEVAKHASQPFTVSVKDPTGKEGAAVKVLGTHFNINAYDDEAAIKTTLLEGLVKLESTSGSKVLKPNQQGQVSSAGVVVAKDVDIEQVVAWKNGLFNFNNSDLQMVMRQISRWYGVEVVYEGQPEQREFGGEIHRDMNLSQVLKLLETNDVHFRIEGKKLIVTP